MQLDKEVKMLLDLFDIDAERFLNTFIKDGDY